MALLGSNVTSEVGLRVLLCPLGSNIVIRTTCFSVGVALPVYSTFKAIETKDQNAQQRCLLYWAAYGSFSLEVFSDKFLSWYSMIPSQSNPVGCIGQFSPETLKALFDTLTFIVLWSSISFFKEGVKHLYTSHLRPFFLRHQTRVDQVVGLAYSEVIFLVIHVGKLQTEFVCGAAHRTLRDIEPGRTQQHNPETIEPDRSQQNSPADEPATSSDSEPDRDHNT